MGSTNGGKNPYLFKYFLTRLLLGVLFVSMVPVVVLPTWRHLLPSNQIYDPINVALVAAAFVATMLSLRKINWFPGSRSILSSIPVLLGWYAVLLGFLFLFRLSYSIPYLIFGFCLSLIWLMIQAYILRRSHRMTLAYVPMGRADHVENIQGVNWYRLLEPGMPHCIDPALSAQIRLLKHKPQRGSSCPAPDVGAGGCKNGSSRQSHGWRVAASRTGDGARIDP